ARDGSIDTLAIDLASLVGTQTEDVHELLWRATCLIKERLTGRAWADVAASIKRQFPALTESDGQYLKGVRSLVAKAAWRSTDGNPHDLYLRIDVDLRTADISANARPGIILVACASLEADVNRSIRELIACGTYADRIGVDLLSHPRLSWNSREYPWVKHITLEFDLIRTRRWPAWNSGIYVGVELTDGREDPIVTCIDGVWFMSGLEPERGAEGELPFLDGFEPRRILSPWMGVPMLWDGTHPL